MDSREIVNSKTDFSINSDNDLFAEVIPSFVIENVPSLVLNYRTTNFNCSLPQIVRYFPR